VTPKQADVEDAADRPTAPGRRSVERPRPKIGGAKGAQPFERAVDARTIFKFQGGYLHFHLIGDLFQIAAMPANRFFEKSVEQVQPGLLAWHGRSCFEGDAQM
jgi:hypothetical protein